MSTKIYNGYKFKENLPLREIQAFCHRLRDKVRPKARELYFKTFFNIHFGVIDKNTFGIYNDVMYFIGKKGGHVSYGVELYMSKRMSNVKISGLRDPAVDFDFSINIIPIKGKVLVLLYTEKKDLRTVFEEMDEIEEYYYQNSSDAPEEISAKAWDRRRKDWDTALGGDGYSTAMECGLNYTPYDSGGFTFFMMSDDERKAALKLLPTVDERALEIARDLHFKKYCTDNPVQVATDAEVKSNAVMKQYWSYCDYMQTDEGKVERKKIVEEVKPQLTLQSIQDLKDVWVDITLHQNIVEMFNKDEKKLKPHWA